MTIKSLGGLENWFCRAESVLLTQETSLGDEFNGHYEGLICGSGLYYLIYLNFRTSIAIIMRISIARVAARGKKHLRPEARVISLALDAIGDPKPQPGRCRRHRCLLKKRPVLGEKGPRVSE
jgi:hypothetical protein